MLRTHVLHYGYFELTKNACNFQFKSYSDLDLPLVVKKKTVVDLSMLLFFKPLYYGDIKVDGPKMEQNWAEEFWNLDGPLSLCIDIFAVKARNTQIDPRDHNSGSLEITKSLTTLEINKTKQTNNSD